MRKETKAERIFKDTYTECRIHVKTWGFERSKDGTAIGFNHLATEELTSTRTWNAIRKLIDSEKRNLEVYRKYGFENSYELKRFALEMVESTLNNTIQSYK